MQDNEQENTKRTI